MSFLETPRFPSCVSFGAVSGPNYSSVRTVVASGFDDVLIRHEQPLHKYTLEHANRTQVEHDELLEFFHAVKGMGHRFRVKDYSDFEVTTANGVLKPLHGTVPAAGASGVGYGTQHYVLQKKYTAGALTTYRDINKPQLAGLNIYRGGVLLVVGGSPGQIAIDTALGKISFVADQTKGITAHTPGASHVITVATAFSPNFTIGQRVFISGVTGTAATALNDLSHVITNVSTNVITIGTTTTGLTANTGSAYFYPQESETLTWEGEFDVPVRFLSDEASFEIVDRQGSGGGLLYSWSGINLTEVRIAMA